MTELQQSLIPFFPDFNPSDNNIQQHLSAYIDHLIVSDFSKLVFILYRLDISESKLQALITQPSDKTAGEIISQMIIERQLQKIESKKENHRTTDNCNEEKW